MAMRVTMHNGRVRKNGTAFTPDHNDRNFDVENADNIKNENVKDNLYWSWNQNDGHFYSEEQRKNFDSFRESEMQFYEENYRKLYEDQMAKHRAARKVKRIKTFDEWKKTKRYCPEESYLQIGKVEEHPDKEIFGKAVKIYLRKMREWNQENGNHMKVLNFALHFDEAVPQIHIRRVWDYEDENGQLRIGQEKALEQAGVPLPDPSKPMSRYNHRKKTFDALMREYWQEACKEAGLDIITEALPNAKYGRTKERFLWDKFEEVTKENEALIEENQRLKDEIKENKNNIQWQDVSLEAKQTKNDQLDEQVAKKQSDLAETIKKQEEANKILESTQNALAEAESRRKEVISETRQEEAKRDTVKAERMQEEALRDDIKADLEAFKDDIKEEIDIGIQTYKNVIYDVKRKFFEAFSFDTIERLAKKINYEPQDTGKTSEKTGKRLFRWQGPLEWFKNLQRDWNSHQNSIRTFYKEVSETFVRAEQHQEEIQEKVNLTLEEKLARGREKSASQDKKVTTIRNGIETEK